MKHKALLSLMFWLFVVTAPAFACLIAVAQFPLEVEVPLHWGFSDQADSWGSPWSMLPASLIICGANALLGISYRYSDKLYDMGLVHSVSREATRPFLCGTAVVLVIVIVVILIWWVIAAKAIM